jgi:hypothetical protein
VTDLAELAAVLRRSGASVQREVGRAVRAEATDLRDDMRELISSQITGLYLPHFAASITSEMTGQLSAEVGPDSGLPQGGMGAAIEFGSAKHGPLPYAMPGADKSDERLPEKVMDAVVRVLQ